MSSKIDGVPRELLERLQSQTELSNDWDEVQALLAAPVVERQPLSVWEGSMPESNGKSNFTVILHTGDLTEGICVYRSEYPDRARYEADCFRHLIGDPEFTEKPFICDYDADKHSGYIKPDASQPAPVAVLHFVCDRIPDQNGCTFIECENSEGSSINAGEWVVRPDGLAQLVVSRPPLKLPEYKRPPPGCVITQEMAAHNACLDKVKELNQ